MFAANEGVTSSGRLYSDDVFSSYIYTGNGSAQTIDNGINLAGNGGLVWIKNRISAIDNHILQDTVRGVNNVLKTNTTDNNIAVSTYNFSFTSSGFGMNNAAAALNQSEQPYASWTFRRAPKFFDVVTWTGDGTGSRSIPHNLGVIPGMYITKATSTTGSWYVRTNIIDGSHDYLTLESASAKSDSLLSYPTASTFNVTSIDGDLGANVSGVTYVAYLFAHDTAAEGLIQCGSYTGNGNFIGPSISLGWEPQFLLIKKASGTGDWQMFDNMRGMFVGSTDSLLQANQTSAESLPDYVIPRATGFEIVSTNASVNSSGASYIYLAIRRRNKPPAVGTQVYNAISRTGTGAAATITGVGFEPDLVNYQSRSTNLVTGIFDRLRGNGRLLYRSDTASEATGNSVSFSQIMGGIGLGTTLAGNNNGVIFINHFFRRAPGFFDIICYSGNGTTQVLSHGLEAVPELIIFRGRNFVVNWAVMSKYTSPAEAWNDSYNVLRLNNNGSLIGVGVDWLGNNSVAILPTSTTITVGANGELNTNNGTHVAYLFASLPGISKVGRYTGNGSTQTINCGFASGARFILIKRIDSTGDWYVWDSVRGIVSDSDAQLSLNSTAIEVISNDSVDPSSSGFIVNQNTSTNINVSSAAYIFLAIA